jgi:hypothetical protein
MSICLQIKDLLAKLGDASLAHQNPPATLVVAQQCLAVLRKVTMAIFGIHHLAPEAPMAHWPERACAALRPLIMSGFPAPATKKMGSFRTPPQFEHKRPLPRGIAVQNWLCFASHLCTELVYYSNSNRNQPPSANSQGTGTEALSNFNGSRYSAP